MKNRITSLLIGLSIAGFLPAQTIISGSSGSVGIPKGEYINSMDRYWYIDAGSSSASFFEITISMSTEPFCDFVSIYSVDNNWNVISTDFHASGSRTDNVVLSIPNGKAVIRFKTDGSVCGTNGYNGFTANYALSSNVTTGSYVSGNSYVAGSLQAGTSPDSQNFKVTGNSIFNGKIWIGTSSSTADLEVCGSSPNFVIRGNTTRLQIGVPSANAYYTPYAVPGDVVFRPLGGVNGHFGLIFNLPTTAGDGKATIKFGDDKHGEWFVLSNNKVAYLNGKLGIGTNNPISELDVNGNIYIPSGKSYWIGSSIDSGNRLRLHHSGANAYIDFAPNLYFRVNSAGNTLTLLQNGNVGIGTGNPQNKLDVNGIIRAKEVKIETEWADYVFKEDYRLPSLTEVKNHIEANKHLPGIPAEAEVKENGVNLGEMQVKLLQKIEELTLYIIDLENRIHQLETK